MEMESWRGVRQFVDPAGALRGGKHAEQLNTSSFTLVNLSGGISSASLSTRGHDTTNGG